MILCKYFHQFAPVIGKHCEALYEPLNLATDTSDQQFRRFTYEEFKKVVILKQQVWVTDPIWHDFLQHVQYGNVQEHHIEMLQKMVIMNPNCGLTNFSSPPVMQHWLHLDMPFTSS